MTYFFVGGSQRAGTTLLQSMLCSDDTTSSLLQCELPPHQIIIPGKVFDRHRKDY